MGLREDLRSRFGEVPDAAGRAAVDVLAPLVGRASCRDFADRPVDPGLVRLLCAVALSAPSKSDLQQRDIVLVEDRAVRAELDALVHEQPWVAAAPAFVMICGNNRRQRQVHALRGRPFPNDHLDAFFNAAVDAAIALQAFVTAAEAVGMGCCPVSSVRDRAEEVSDLLGLADHVFPVAGLALGWPAGEAVISPRLPLSVTVHVDRFDDSDLEARIEDYDKRRAAAQPYPTQRMESDYGHDPSYGWSEDKARQYSRPQRAGFGAFVRGKGFDLG